MKYLLPGVRPSPCQSVWLGLLVASLYPRVASSHQWIRSRIPFVVSHFAWTGFFGMNICICICICMYIYIIMFCTCFADACCLCMITSQFKMLKLSVLIMLVCLNPEVCWQITHRKPHCCQWTPRALVSMGGDPEKFFLTIL